jgi:hypothetical protein
MALDLETARKRLSVGYFLVFRKTADTTTDKAYLFRVVGFDKLGRPRILKRWPVSSGLCESVWSVPRCKYHYYRVIGREGIPHGELTDCMAATEAYWREYPEEREKATGKKI